MTTTGDPVAAFLNALPDHHRPHHTERLTALIHRATRNGWTVPQLAAEATRNPAGAINLPAVVMTRLEAAARKTAPGRSAEKIHHGCCDNGWIYDETGDRPVQTRCPGRREKADA